MKPRSTGSQARRQLLVWLSAWPLTGWSQTTTSSAKARLALTGQQVVYRSTRLSVLSDRIARCQAQKMLGILVARSDKVLTESLTESVGLLADLKPISLSAQARELLNTADRDFQILTQSIDRLRTAELPALLQLADLADKAGTSIDQFTEVFIKETAARHLVILQTTADLLRLTQHNAVHFFLARAGLAEAEQVKVLEKGMADFERLLAELRRSPLANDKISNAKQLLDNQWIFMRQALESKAKDANALQTVATTSERTFEVLFELYGHFEALAKLSSGR